MEDNLFNLNNKIYSNNNNILLEIINELNQIKSDSNENLTIQRLGNKINSEFDQHVIKFYNDYKIE